MKIVIFGASGMVGEGVLKESLLASDVTHITVIARKKLDRIDAKLDQIIIPDLYKTEYLQSIQNYDACFFCIGQSVTGLTEEEYQHVTYELTTRIAQAVVTHNPDMTFIYVSGSGTDSSESGKTMWARIKGKTENALLKMDFKAVYLFRPAIIQPLDGIQSKTKSYRLFYRIMKPFFPIFKFVVPNSILTTQSIGIAMLNAMRRGYSTNILEVKDIVKLSNNVE
ncbi:hypothetical protein QLG01_06780 [Acinetobacter sp. V89_4]|uniref:hypothetical protein n=1 Tax=Acinetobacter sp. V89_4 TaxID=3044232 RepID=UPI00249E097A|nr:hypothetical protein [Acinetobacter sp. V89_4]MDI3452895.1 hypothetical protein [Acinetobacter sp. V89_4]